jgi:hypothetical protein
MWYIVLSLLITSGYILGAPISRDSLQFRLVECIPGENDTLSKYVLELTNINETCIQVNKTLPGGHEVFLYVAPATDTGVQIHITTESCSTPVPKLHLSLCDDDDDDNSTQHMVTFKFKDLVAHNISDDDHIESTTETMLYTGPTVYETLHHLDEEFDHEQNVTEAPSFNLDRIGTPIYETMHHLNEEFDHEHNITTDAPSFDFDRISTLTYETIHDLNQFFDKEQNITDDEPSLNLHQTGTVVYETMHHLDFAIHDEQVINTTESSFDAEKITGPTVYETMHHLDLGLHDEQVIHTTESSFDAEKMTGPTVYETMHHLDHDSDEEQDKVTILPFLNKGNVTKEVDISSSSSSEDED